MTYHTTLQLVDGLAVSFDSEEQPQSEVIDGILYLDAGKRTEVMQASHLALLTVVETTND